MSKISDFILVGTVNLRTYFYLSLLKNMNIRLENVLIYQNTEFNLDSMAGESISLLGYTVNLNESFRSLCTFHQAKFIDCTSINEMGEILRPYVDKYILFSGKGIVKASLTDGFSLIHIHPGKLPKYRGSTTVYYSLLLEDNITASAFFMEQGIDTGRIIYELSIGGEKIIQYSIDYLVDPMIRAVVLVRLLLNFQKEGKLTSKKQQANNERTYYKIHPVLRHIVQRKTKSI